MRTRVLVSGGACSARWRSRLRAGEAQVFIQPVVGLQHALALGQGLATGSTLGTGEDAAGEGGGDFTVGAAVASAEDGAGSGRVAADQFADFTQWRFLANG